MCVTGQHISALEHGGWYGFAFGVIDLHDGGGSRVEELSVVKLMTPVFFPVEDEPPIAQREFSICLPCRNFIGQDTAHGVFAIIGHNALAQVHHAATLCDDVSATFGKGADGSVT